MSFSWSHKYWDVVKAFYHSSSFVSSLLPLVISLDLSCFDPLTFSRRHKLSWANKQRTSEQWWQKRAQEKSSNLFLDHFVARRPGRKQEVNVGAEGMGAEQKNWSRLEGKWAWWALASVSQIDTDNKQIDLPPLNIIKRIWGHVGKVKIDPWTSHSLMSN